MFVVACAHCILTTKFEGSFFSMVFVFTNHLSTGEKKRRKTYFKIIVQPEHAEDISSIYLLNQIFESVSDLLEKENQKGYDPYLYNCLCVYIFLFY